MAVFGLVTLAVASLEYFFFTDNFSMAYVAEHSNHALPLFYKITLPLGAAEKVNNLFWSWLRFPSLRGTFGLFHLKPSRLPELIALW